MASTTTARAPNSRPPHGQGVVRDDAMPAAEDGRRGGAGRCRHPGGSLLPPVEFGHAPGGPPVITARRTGPLDFHSSALRRLWVSGLSIAGCERTGWRVNAIPHRVAWSAPSYPSTPLYTTKFSRQPSADPGALAPSPTKASPTTQPSVSRPARPSCWLAQYAVVVSMVVLTRRGPPQSTPGRQLCVAQGVTPPALPSRLR